MFLGIKAALKVSSGATLVCAALLGSVVAQAGTTMDAVTALPTTNPRVKAFMEFFTKDLNAAHEETLRIKYIGGPEVVPPRKAAGALSRGVMDILYSPVAYYAGQVPEGNALEVSTRKPQEVRASGAFDALDAIWQRKINAKILAWGSYGTQYNIYLTTEPKFGPDGVLDLNGFKMRSTSTYRPLLSALGATPVEMPASDIFTALQRGVIQGFSFPDSGVLSLGVERIVKYRVDPSFYHGANLILINMNTWKAATKAERDILTALSRNYEEKEDAYVRNLAAEEAAVLKKHGMEVVAHDSGAAAKFLKIAYDELWKRIEDRSEDIRPLKPKLYAE